MENAKLLMSVDELIAATGLSKTTVFGLFRKGKLRPVKIGRRTFVRPVELQSFLDASAV